jgi:hypothetical protein
MAINIETILAQGYKLPLNAFLHFGVMRLYKSSTLQAFSTTTTTIIIIIINIIIRDDKDEKYLLIDIAISEDRNVIRREACNIFK